MFAMAAAEERVGRNEAAFRELNEELNELGERLDSDDGFGSFVCECSSPSCRERVELTPREYEQVRADPTHFLVVPGHIWHPESEREVYRTDRYAVIEKRGEAEDEAIERDPRSS